MKIPLAQSCPAERGQSRSVLQTALRLAPQPFGRHIPPAGRDVSGLSPRGDGDARGIEPRAHRPTDRLGSGPALGPKYPARVRGGLLVLLVALAGCSRSPEAGNEAWFPLAAGHRWTYRVTTQSGADTSERESLTLRTLGRETLALDDQPAWVRRSDSGINYWLRSDEMGIRRVALKSDMQADPVADPAGRFVLKAPFVVGTQWQAGTTPYLLMRTHEYPRELKHSHPNIPMIYTIEATGDEVQVAAGRFSPCLRVRGSATVRVFVDPISGFKDQPLNSVEWYCRGVGLVKMVRSEPSTSPMLVGGSRTLELESWE